MSGGIEDSLPGRASTGALPATLFTDQPNAPIAPPAAQLVDELAALIERRAMLQFGTDRRSYLISTTSARARAAGFTDCGLYIKSVLAQPSGPEFMSLVDDLTINETTFFRNVPQLELFARVAVREIVERKRTSGEAKRLDVWSAGCSTGQEVYTLAALARDGLKVEPSFALRVIGTDIAQSVVDTARHGVYPKARLEATPIDVLQRHFEDLGDSIRANAALRSHTSFHQHNLRDPFPPGRYDVIFCRNVMIYFSRDEQMRLAREFFARLNPGGFLFIGHSESLQGLGVDFRLRIESRGVAYQKAS